MRTAVFSASCPIWVLLVLVTLESPQTEAAEGTNVSLEWDYDLEGATFRELEWKDDDSSKSIAEWDDLLVDPYIFSAFRPRFSVDKNQKATLIIRNVTKADSGRYSCTLQGSQGGNRPEVVSMTTLRVLHPVKIVEARASASPVLEGSEVFLVCTADGSPPPYVAWIAPNGITLQNRTGDTNITFPNVSRDDNGTYRCEATNGVDPFDFATVPLGVFFPAKILLGENVTDIEGNDTVLVCKVEGNSPPWVAWVAPNGTAVQNRTSGTDLRLPSVSRDSGGSYSCSVTNGLRAETERVYLDVQYPPGNTSFAADHANTSAVVRGTTVNFVCTSNAHPPAHEFKLLRNGEQIQNGISGNFSLNTYESGSYACEAVNKVGRQKSEEINITVVVFPTVSPPYNRTVIEGLSTSIPCNEVGTPPLAIKWTRVSDSQVVSNSSELYLSNVPRPGDSGKTIEYRCTARNGYGEPASAVVTVHLY